VESIDFSALNRWCMSQEVFLTAARRPNVKNNQMIAFKEEYEATGRVHRTRKGQRCFRTGGRQVRLHANIQNKTGAIRKKWKPRQAWSRTQSLRINQSPVLNTPEGLVAVPGCRHAGIIPILTFARTEFPDEPVKAVVGGPNLPPADEQLNWTADQMKEFKEANLIGHIALASKLCIAFGTTLHCRENPRLWAV
jgi:7,8-dihydropterin-6-yl-methyl-4-(beta-D-ribofuranosyl)aminobenzene 5'-phosphate synthase